MKLGKGSDMNNTPTSIALEFPEGKMIIPAPVWLGVPQCAIATYSIIKTLIRYIYQT